MIPINHQAILDRMEKLLQEQSVRYNREVLEHYVQMRLSTANTSYLGGPKPGQPGQFVDKTIRDWVKAFRGKYT